MDKKCKKKQTQKDRIVAEANTRKNKARKAYFTFKHSNFKDMTALESLASTIYPEKVRDWVNRVNPEGF